MYRTALWQSYRTSVISKLLIGHIITPLVNCIPAAESELRTANKSLNAHIIRIRYIHNYVNNYKHSWTTERQFRTSTQVGQWIRARQAEHISSGASKNWPKVQRNISFIRVIIWNFANIRNRSMMRDNTNSIQPNEEWEQVILTRMASRWSTPINR